MKGRRQLLTILALVGSGLVVVVAGLLLVILPQRSKVASLHKEFAKTQTQILSIEATRGGASSLRASQLYELSRAMPQSDDMPGILLDLSRAAAGSSTRLMSVRPAVHVSLPDGSSAVPLQVVLDGSFAGVSRFLHNLRSAVRVVGTNAHASSRLFLADNVAISSNDASTASGAAPASEVTANLQLVAFDYAAPPAASAGPVVAAVDGSASSATAAGAPAGGN
jgi:Tfp pilus assembly protein PilO